MCRVSLCVLGRPSTSATLLTQVLYSQSQPVCVGFAVAVVCEGSSGERVLDLCSVTQRLLCSVCT